MTKTRIKPATGHEKQARTAENERQAKAAGHVTKDTVATATGATQAAGNMDS